MSFRDYSLNPTENTELGDGTYIGPGMFRNKVRPAFQQLAADGKELADEVDQLAGPLVVTGAAGQSVSARLLLSGIAAPVANQSAILTESGREGTFVFSTANLSASVTADPQQGIYVAPASDTTGASGAWVRKYDDHILAKWFGVSSSSADNYAAINAARAVASSLSRPLILPEGTLILNQATPTFTLNDYEDIRGTPGTVIHVSDTLNSTASIFAATGKKGIRISGFKIEANSIRTGGNIAFDFRDCVDCYVGDVVMDKWTNGVCFMPSGGGAVGVGPIPPATSNLRNKAERCVSLSSRSYAFFMNAATACEFINCGAYGATNQDGFKFGGGTMFAKVIGCHSEGNNGDGFDTYDGFIASIMADCTSYNNTSNGFQAKGTLGGTYTSGDYVTRHSSFSNLVAIGNALAGFLFQETRYGVASGLVALGNGTSGFILNNVQNYTFSGCLGSRNTQHGWSLIGNTSQCRFNGCEAIDNSYVDGTTQNGTYDGWNFGAATTCYLNGCTATNGTESGKLGGQGYAYNFVTSVGMRLTGCGAGTSRTGAVGGTNSPLTNNQFIGFDSAGTLQPFGAGTVASLAGIGYATGAGSAVVQATSRTTGVTINTACGQITLCSAAGSATWQTFTVTNTAVGASDTVRVVQKSGTDLYQIHVTNVAAGSFKISYATTGGTTTEQPVFNFSVLKGATS